jgi:uncharacterized membrane protein
MFMSSCLRKQQQIFYHEQGTKYLAKASLLLFQHPLISGVLSETICMDQDFHLFHPEEHKLCFWHSSDVLGSRNVTHDLLGAGVVAL